MERRWVYSDRKRNQKEFDALPNPDQKALVRAMARYAVGDDVGYRHETYDYGIEMLTDGGRGQGRCLYFRPGKEGGIEILAILRFYKKESQKAPPNIIEAARRRRATYRRDPEEPLNEPLKESPTANHEDPQPPEDDA